MKNVKIFKLMFAVFFTASTTLLFAQNGKTTCTGCSVPKNVKEYTLQYDFIKKQWVDTPKKWYPKNALIRIQVLNVNQNAFDVNYELKNYQLDNQQGKSSFINTFMPSPGAETTTAQSEVDSATDKLNKLNAESGGRENPFMANDKSKEAQRQREKDQSKKALQNAKAVNQSIITINKKFDSLNGLIKAYNGTVSILNTERTVTNELADTIKKKANEALLLLKSWVDDTKVLTNSITTEANKTEDLLNSNEPFPKLSEGFNKAEKQSVIGKFKTQVNSFNTDSLYLIVAQLHRTLTNDNNYTFFIPEFEAKGYEIETTIKYRQKSSTGAFSSLTLPSLYTSANLRLGFGAGPLLVFIPGQHSFYKQEFRGVDSLNTKDSVMIVSRKANNNLSFGIASFLDLDFQCSKTVSLGVGVGGGLNISEKLDGNLYTGFNLGFRVAEKTQLSFRIGAAFAKTTILKDQYDSGIKYEKTFVEDEYTTQKWKVGLYAGITVNLLTRSLTAASEKQVVDK